MQIHSLQQTNVAQSVNSTNASKPTNASQTVESGIKPQADQLDLSPEALEISQTQQAATSSASEIRTEKVAAIKQAIADGTYETPEKLDAALDRLLDTFA